ncbi:MAG TPA: PPOX class F420-dependent oxidoreductase [Anaerolineales bacterium]|nr:PPOX class F420-dependent oxidoreductase [Anaerolineales bacterium]
MSLDLIPQTHQDLLEDSKKAYAQLATIMDDGSPQLTMVWFNTDGEHLLVNSTKGRVKDHNMRRRRKVALLIHDPDDYYHYIQVRGHVAEITREGAREHIDELAGKYTGTAKYKGIKPGMVRVMYKIEPDSVTAR